MRVAVYAIAHNEEERAAKWAQNVRQEMYPGDEVIVVDVDSTDRTVVALRSQNVFPRRISIRPFRFDIARNTALALVPTDITCCICLDFDERLAYGWRDHLEQLWSSHGNYTVIKYQFAPDLIFADARRVHSRFGWRWRYPAHEGLYSYGALGGVMIQTPPPLLEPFIIHEQNISKDRSQYLGMLKIGLDENPDSCRMLHYYGRELYYRQQYAEALFYLEKYYTVKPANYSNPWEEGEHKKIIDFCHAAAPEWKDATLQP